jgi:hypothetical protein
MAMAVKFQLVAEYNRQILSRVVAYKSYDRNKNSISGDLGRGRN